MSFLIKRASAFTIEEQTIRGISGIPQNWPVEKYAYIDTILDGFELITEEDLSTLVYNNQAAYDAWVQALRPIVQAPSNIQSVTVVAQPNVVVGSSPAFTAKTVIATDGSTKKLYARTTGFQASVAVGANSVSYTATYPWAKVTGIEVINCEALDVVQLKVLDTTTGTYSTIPNYTLNQFGFTVSLPKDFYQRISQFDADLYVGMVLRIEYTSVSAKTVGFNLIMNEVK